MGPRFFPPRPCSQYTGFEACRMQTSFLIPAWYCTDCFSACHWKSLNPTDHSLSDVLWDKNAHSYFPPDLWAWIETQRVGVLRTAEGMISSFMIFDNNGLSWRRRRRRHIYKTNALLERKTSEIHGLAPSVPICTCALIRCDCCGHFESTRWVTAG